MGASTTDAEWAHIFEVRLHAYSKVHSLPCCLVHSQPASEGCSDGGCQLPYHLVMCRCVEAMQETCSVPLCSMHRSRIGHGWVNHALCDHTSCHAVTWAHC